MIFDIQWPPMIFTMSTPSPLVMVREGMDGSLDGVGSVFNDQVLKDKTT